MFKKPEFGSIQLSPNQKLLAVIAPLKGRLNIAILDMEKKSIFRLTALTDTDVQSYFWLTNDRIVFATGDAQGFDFRGNGGVYAVNTDGGGGKELNKPSRSRAADGQRVLRTFEPLGRVKGSKDEIYVSTNERSIDTTDIYVLNTTTGRKTLLTFDSPGNVQRWVFDADSVPRAALTQDRKGQKHG